MAKSDALVEQYYALKPADFGFLECLELRQAVQPENWAGFNLTLVLRASTLPNAKGLRLAFKGVRDLRIGTVQGLVRYLLEIRAVHEQQMEDRSYKVVESEYNAFAFFCRTFAATVEERLE
jgi:hypothetical protein